MGQPQAGNYSDAGNNGTAGEQLNAGHVYIQAGTAYCGGGSSNACSANVGNINFLTGKTNVGNTYYNSNYTGLMTMYGSTQTCVCYSSFVKSAVTQCGSSTTLSYPYPNLCIVIANVITITLPTANLYVGLEIKFLSTVSCPNYYIVFPINFINGGSVITAHTRNITYTCFNLIYIGNVSGGNSWTLTQLY